MTAVLLSNFVWEGNSTEMASVVASDGQIYKQLDTGESYIHRAGAWQFINLGLSYIKATKSGSIVTNGSGIYDVVFTTPLYDANYTIQLTCAEDGTNQPTFAGFSNLTINGFRITTRYTRTGNIKANASVAWLATRNYNP